MRALGLSLCLAAGVAAEFVPGRCQQAEQGLGQPPAGNEEAWSASDEDGTPRIDPDDIFLPETPAYIVARAERIERNWHELGEKLNRPVSLDVSGAKLVEVARQIAARIETPIQIDIQAFTDAGVNPEEAMTLKLDAVPAEEAFGRLLAPLDLTVCVEGGSLLVTTQELADENLSTRVYAVGDLVVSRGEREPDVSYSELIQTIQSTTSGPWFDVDGTGGTLSPYQLGGVQALVVRQTFSVQREVEQLLYGLRSARSEAVRKRFEGAGE
jgi:hypothetical protein